MKIFRFIFLVIAFWISAQNGAFVSALTQTQLNIFNSGVMYYDSSYNPLQCTSTQTSGNSNNRTIDSGSVYILGDSITMFTESKYKSIFESNGYTTQINGSGGRAWVWGGSTNTPQGTTRSGRQAVADDASKISSAAAIVVALGSNGGLSANPIDDMVREIRVHNPTSPLWFVNTTYSSVWNDADSTLGDFNKELQQKAGQYSIVDWYREVSPTGDPSVTPSDDPKNILSDGLHPNTAGTDALSSLVYGQVTGKSSTGSAPSAEPATSNTGTYSATVWSAQKTLPPEWIPILGRAAQRFQVDPAMLAALLSIETGWSTPGSFATDPRRNSASATGPFQFIDSTAVEYMPAPDVHSAITDPARYTSKVIKNLNGGSDREPDGSYVADGNKDGKVDRATPEDAALMAAAYMKYLGASSATPLGEAGDYRVPAGARNEQLTVRIFGAYYNQGPGFRAPDATTKEQLNALARGNNDVAHYMDQMMEVTKAGRESGVFGGVYAQSGTCSNSPATGAAQQYISDCSINNGNAEIACTAINELMGVSYSMEQRAPATDPAPAFLDCSALVNMAIYRTFGKDLGGMCSAEFKTSEFFEIIDVTQILPGDMVGRGSVCGTQGHIAVVVSYDPSTKKLITIEASSSDHPSGLRGIGGDHGYSVGLEVDGNGSYEWAVRCIGPKTAVN